MKSIKLLIISGLAGLTACTPSFLDVKPSQNQRVPKTLADYQALLDHSNMNGGASRTLAIIGTDEYALSDAQWARLPATGANAYQKQAYIWDDDADDALSVKTDWTVGYLRIETHNVVLEGIKGLQNYPIEDLNQTRGTALFLRALRFYEMAQLFCKPYDAATADADPGLPLRLEADVTVKVGRSSLQHTYDQIVGDLEQAAMLLPNSALFVQQVGKPAAYALLARVYLQLGNYPAAKKAAEQCLTLKKELIDYNLIANTSSYPFPKDGKGNQEMIFMNQSTASLVTNTTYYNANPDLFNSYSEDDLRKDLFFRLDAAGKYQYIGSYTGGSAHFVGLATDEVYLIRSESNLRLGNMQDALEDLNYLRKHRYQTAQYVPFGSENQTEILAEILAERRKELVLRGTRWEDLRRLNKEPAFAKPLIRELNGDRYTLLPGDLRYVWYLPPQAIGIGGYSQNER